MGDTSTLGDRAKEVRKDARKTQAEMAEFLEISLGAFQKLERDEVIPNGETLLRFAKLGVNPGWLLSGLGPKSMTDTKNASIDADLLVDVKAIIDRVHQEAGITLRPETLDRKAIEHYNEYMAADTDVGDAEEMKLWLALLAKRLKREVLAARDAPGTGKRSAS